MTAVVLATTGVAALTLAQSASAASGCQVSYTSSPWPGGFSANISITNLGSPLSSWTLGFTLPGTEAVGQGWSATYSQSGQNVTATNVSYNGSLGTNAGTSIGFNGTYSASTFPGNPTSFTLNGTSCTGAVSSGSPSSTPTKSPTPTPTPTPSASGSSGGYLYEDSGQWAQYSIGGYTIYNDEWGSGHGSQTLWVKSATNWGVFSTQPNTSGVKSYANISKNVGVALNSLSSATSSFNETNPSGGNWESAYDIWLNGTGIEVMVWTYVSGNVGPLGSSVGSVTLDGNTWTLYAGNNGTNPTYSFVRSSNESSGTVNILDLLKYLENTKGYFANPMLSTIQYGWEISGTNNTQENFTVNNYSASAS
ncbi:cellulose binding domain-containing protein [Actinocrinis puniceicyclus]|uniref:Cellulose binding domain-containing protein n=1 Tax=Actinocrinis puniceicyclus TaxID=977794 RepID=A0A8J7WSY9_9ACTN|nr:cellulose binding domain-containing protein [Actinocrinis puniceicyclus]MBS2965447.1 cellulose binding domain-containing protein [Actinocrinis puniceicyclus]